MNDVGACNYPEGFLKPHKQAHTIDAWQVFRIMSEFVDGFESMHSLAHLLPFSAPQIKIQKTPNTRNSQKE